MTKKSSGYLEYEGAALSAALLRKANEMGINAGDIADRCGISRPYFSTIMSGQRPWAALGRDKVESVAEFLKVPVLTVFILSGLIKKEDFYYKEKITEQLDVSLRLMREDPKWMAYAPIDAEWEGMRLADKLRIILLYLEVSKQQLIDDFSEALKD